MGNILDHEVKPTPYWDYGILSPLGHVTFLKGDQIHLFSGFEQADQIKELLSIWLNQAVAVIVPTIPGIEFFGPDGDVNDPRLRIYEIHGTVTVPGTPRPDAEGGNYPDSVVNVALNVGTVMKRHRLKSQSWVSARSGDVLGWVPVMDETVPGRVNAVNIDWTDGLKENGRPLVELSS